MSKSIAASAGYSLLSRDLLSLDNLVFKAKSSNSDMEYVAIVTPDTKAVVHSDAVMSWGDSANEPRTSDQEGHRWNHDKRVVTVI